MKITYDLEFLPERWRTKTSEEVLALKAFLAGKQKNMCIQYEDEALCKRRYDSLRAFRTSHQQQKVFDLYRCIFRPSESKETVGVSPPSREKQVQVHGRESTGVLFWKEMAKERFAKRSSACHLFRLESFSFAHGVISIDEDLVGTVLNPVQHSIC